MDSTSWVSVVGVFGVSNRAFFFPELWKGSVILCLGEMQHWGLSWDNAGISAGRNDTTLRMVFSMGEAIGCVSV